MLAKDLLDAYPANIAYTLRIRVQAMDVCKTANQRQKHCASLYSSCLTDPTALCRSAALH